VRVELAQGGRVVVHGRTDGLGVLSGENLIINGDFRINQHGYVSGALTDGYDFFDRWEKLENTALSTFSTSPQGQMITYGVTDAPRRLRQTVERKNVEDDVYVLSHAGTADARVYNKGSSAPLFAPTPLVVTLDGSDDVRVEFYAADDTIGKVKLEHGTVPTPYVPRQYSEELALCQEYYIRFKPPAGTTVFSLMNGSMHRAEAFFGVLPLPVPMRAAPTLTYSATADFEVFTGGSNLNPSAISLSRAGSFAQEVNFTVSGATQGHAAWVRVDNSGWLAFDAEL